MVYSEFTDEYQDWLAGESGATRGMWFDTTLGELECPPVASVDPDTTLRDVIGIMNDRQVGCVLVMDGNRLVGIFTERDVLRKVIPGNYDIDIARVGELMTLQPETLPSDALLAHALRVMALGGFRHLPVLSDDGTPMAVVSMRRIIQHVSETFPKEILNAPPERQAAARSAEGG